MEILNKRAFFDYEILEKFEAGIQLVGCEVKSIRAGNANIKDSFARVKNNELFLTNMHISPYSHGNIHNPEETRERKLLLKKSEILRLIGTLQQQNLHLLPLKVYLKNNRYVKVQLGLGKSKKKFDKRDKIKKRELNIELQRKYNIKLK
jgi:SsrA-binding protein